MQVPFQPPRIVPLKMEAYARNNVQAGVLRLDEIHAVISGNKWFKLQAYLAEAQQQQKKAVLTFGGAWSNHIVATAAACAARGLASIGIIRGEAPKTVSRTLFDAQHYGMQFVFTSREAYKSKLIPPEAYGHLKKSDVYVIAEGGYGPQGAAGSMDILKSSDTKHYTYIVAAVGTGTMLAGLINAAQPHQHVLGISVLKNNFSVEGEVQKLLHPSHAAFHINYDFHFGGYARHTPELLQFMNDWFRTIGIPTDFVYTAKTFYAADQLIRNGFFASGSSVLLIHSGGLQGNRSLPPGTLLF